MRRPLSRRPMRTLRSLLEAESGDGRMLMTKADLIAELLQPSSGEGNKDPVATFTLKECLPTKWAIETNDQGFALEVLTFECENIIRADGSVRVLN